MAERVLRDQCDHGRYEAHTLSAPGWPEPEECLGGREVTIDYEAAAEYLSKLIDASPDETWPGEFLPYAKVESRKILDAALGEGGG